MRRAVFLLFAVLALVAISSPPRADAAPRKLSIVGGTQIPIESVPYQVFVRIGGDLGCGGSVLDPTRVLTAAHCVMEAGQPRPTASLTVMAGFDRVAPRRGNDTQVSDVTSVRVHPLYDEATKTDDVAVLTLEDALDLSGPRVKAIALAPVGAGPAPGRAARLQRLRHAGRGQVARRLAVRRDADRDLRRPLPAEHRGQRVRERAVRGGGRAGRVLR